MGIQDAAANFSPMRMSINKAGHDRLACHVEHFCPGRNRALWSDALDAVVFHHNIRILQDFITLHRHDGSAPQHNRPLRRLPWNFQVDRDLLDVLVLFLQFLRFFFLVFLFVLVGVRPPPSFLSPSFFSSSLGGSKETALKGSRKKLAPTAQVIVFPSSAQLK